MIACLLSMSLSLFFASSLKAGTSFPASSCTCLSGRKGLFQSSLSSLCSDQAGLLACPTPRVFRACKEHANLASYILHSPSLRGLLLSYLLIESKDLGFKFIVGCFICFTCDNTSRRAFRLASISTASRDPFSPKPKGTASCPLHAAQSLDWRGSFWCTAAFAHSRALSAPVMMILMTVPEGAKA